VDPLARICPNLLHGVSTQAGPRSKFNLRNYRYLIVDDDPGNPGDAGETLSNFGYRCFGTSDPQEALAYVSSGKGRIVLWT